MTADLDELTDVGEVYVASLVRTQRRLAAGVLGAFFLTVAAIPLLFAVAPALRTAAVLGVGVPWLLLGVLAYPVIGLAAWAFVRAAERAERDFSDLVGGRR